MNTTRLISQWSMDGARTDLHRGFHSAVDILAALAGRSDEPAAPPSESAVTDALLVKPAGGGDWQPLLAGSA
jgi:hypothetical protein